jgi:chromate transporter
MVLKRKPNAWISRRSQITHVTREQNVEQAVRLRALFTAFLIISLCGVGGGAGMVWAQRITVQNRRWLSDSEFADIVSLCQFLPGPNIVGIAVCIGTKMRGAIGAVAALCGFLVIPLTVGLSLGLLYLNYAHLTVVRDVLGGIAATAAGLLIATGIRLLMPHRHRPAALLFAALAFALIIFGRVPLLVVLFGLVPVSIVVAGIQSASAR